MDPNTKTDKGIEAQIVKSKYSRYKDVSIVIFWAIIFVVILSFFSFNKELNPASVGDAGILSTAGDVENRINSVLDEVDSSDSKVDAITLDQAISTASTTLLSKPDIQYVIISFDGSRSIPMWNETRQFAKDMSAKGKPVHFTYFINPIYLITKDVAKIVYQPPTSKIGESMIGYADNEQDVKNRVEQINQAYLEGNEIGSHNVGHFSGSKWRQDQWLQEFNSFDSIIANVQKNNPNVSIQPWVSGLQNFVGFRAPELGVNSDLYKALSEKKYLYDASGMRLPNKYPTKDKNGVWHIGLGIIKMNDLHSGLLDTASKKPHHVLSMDYNFWMLQSKTKNIAKKGTPLWNSFYTEVKDAYVEYFNNNYNGNHAPVVIGHHFSTWNDGVYWEALKSFAEDVCGKPNVKCVTFKEYVSYLNSSVK